jgi:hypothetical protein
VRTTGTLAALMAALVLSASLSSTACDLSCAFNQLSSNCDQTARLTEPMQAPMQMEGMDHAHCKHQLGLGQIEIATIHAPFSMGSCKHQPCDKPATVSSQKISPTAPQLGHSVFTVVAHLQPDDPFIAMYRSNSDSFPMNLSALDPPSTSLRI